MGSCSPHGVLPEVFCGSRWGLLIKTGILKFQLHSEPLERRGASLSVFSLVEQCAPYNEPQHCRRNRTWLRAPREAEAVDERATGDPWATAQGAVTISPAPHQIVWVPHAYLSISGKVTGVAYTHFYSEKSILTQPKK